MALALAAVLVPSVRSWQRSNGVDALLVAAVKRNDMADVRELLARGASPQAVEPEQPGPVLQRVISMFYLRGLERPVLIVAIGNSYLNHTGCISEKSAVSNEIVIALLDAGADTNVRNNGGMSPLMCACVAGRKDCCDALLRHHADVNAANEAGVTPLMCCSGPTCDMSDEARKLISMGANVNAVDNGGNSVLDFAASYDRVGLVRVLVENHANKATRNMAGKTARDESSFLMNDKLDRLLQ
jgi:ankyrin repeat protein